MNEDAQDVRRRLLGLIEVMQGDEIGTVTQIVMLLTAAGLQYLPGGTMLMVQGPAGQVPIRLKNRRQMLDWARRNSLEAALGEDDGEQYAAAVTVIPALIAAAAGPDAMLGAVTELVELRQAHTDRVEHLRRKVEEEGHATA